MQSKRSALPSKPSKVQGAQISAAHVNTACPGTAANKTAVRPEFVKWVTGRRERFRVFYQQLHHNQKLYVITLISFVFPLWALFCRSIADLVVPGWFGDIRPTLYPALVLWCWTVIYELSRIYVQIFEFPLGKAILLIIFSIATTFALVMSGQVINGITGAEPSKFPHTIAIVSTLTIPFFVAMGSGILWAVFVILVSVFGGLGYMIRFLIKDMGLEFLYRDLIPKSGAPYPKLTKAVQLISISFFCGTFYSAMGRFAEVYDIFVAEKAAWFLYEMEMLSKSPCTTPPGSKIAYLGDLADNKILMARRQDDGSISFEVADCTDEKPKAAR